MIFTERLFIRPIELKDSDAFFDLMSDPEFARIAGTEVPQSREVMLSSVKVFMDLNQYGFYKKWVICLKDSDQFIGECEIYPTKPQVRPWDEWVLGFSLSPIFWRKGYMYEALRAFLIQQFENSELVRVKADVHQGNQASAQLLKKLGFKFEGLQRSKLKIYDRTYDMELFSLLKGELT